MAVTLRMVAKQAEVSSATVSRVLNDHPNVSDAVRQRVLQAIKELNYHVSAPARSLRLRKTHTIGIVVPSLENPFFPGLAARATADFNPRGYKVLVTTGDRPEEVARWLVQTGSVDGLIVVGNTARGERDRDEEWAGLVPIVAFDRPVDIPAIPTYATDNIDGATLIAEHFLDLGRGSFGVISGPHRLSVTEERTEAYVARLSSAGVPAEDIQIVEGDFSEASGERALERMWERGPVDALFCENDLMAIGAVRSAKRLGISVPGELAVAGFDGIALAEYVTPSLTTYEQPVDQLARLCTEALLERLASGQQRLTDGDVRLKGQLRLRESSSE